MSTGSAHLRQVTEWLSEIDQATSTQHLKDAGPVFGIARMNLRPLSPELYKSRLADHELRVQKQDSGVRTITGEEWAPDVEGTTDRVLYVRLLQN